MTFDHPELEVLQISDILDGDTKRDSKKSGPVELPLEDKV